MSNEENKDGLNGINYDEHISYLYAEAKKIRRDVNFVMDSMIKHLKSDSELIKSSTRYESFIAVFLFLSLAMSSFAVVVAVAK